MKPGIKKPVLIFLAIIFILSGIIIVTRGIQLPAISFLQSKKSPETQTTKKADFKVQNNKIIVEFSDFNLFLNECCSSVIQNIHSEKDKDSIKVTGKASFPFPANFEAKITPYVENQQLTAKISDLMLGKIESPQMLDDKLSGLIATSLNDKINKQYKVKDAKITSEGLEVIIK